MKTVFSNKDMCCGCTACESSCPKNAINMSYDEQGFAYPEIDQSICVDCGICKSVCAFQNGYKNNILLSDQKVFACKNQDKNIQLSSSSGGVFSVLGEYFIKSGGVVYGVAFNDNLKVCHIRANNLNDLEKLKSSKYIQSNISGCFQSVKSDLDNNKKVLFSGTGCQIQGLKDYLKKDYENLLLVDIVCHGVPSQKIFDDYISYMEKLFGAKANSVNFRSKKIYNETKAVNISFSNGKSYLEYPDLDAHINIFANNLSLRPSCFNCKYANTNRPSDITIGDFWKAKEKIPKFNDKKGVSIVIVNTDKGINIFNSIKEKLFYMETKLEKSLQPNLIAPSKKPQNYNKFWQEYFNNGYKSAFQKFAMHSKSYEIKRKAKNFILKTLKK